MEPTQIAVCLWPGLPELWYRGRWSGLPAAILFTAVLNFLIVARFVYPEWLYPLLVRIACWVAAGVWIMLVVKQISQLPHLLAPRLAQENPDGFPTARNHYLAGRYSEAEAILSDCLQIDARDCQSHLLLASVYRQTDRWEAATRTLDTLARLETADAWWLECETERRKLRRAMDHASESEPAENATEEAEATPAS